MYVPQACKMSVSVISNTLKYMEDLYGEKRFKIWRKSVKYFLNRSFLFYYKIFGGFYPPSSEWKKVRWCSRVQIKPPQTYAVPSTKVARGLLYESDSALRHVRVSGLGIL